MVGMLDYRLHYGLLAAEERLQQFERRQAPSGSRIHNPSGRQAPRERRRR